MLALLANAIRYKQDAFFPYAAMVERYCSVNHADAEPHCRIGRT